MPALVEKDNWLIRHCRASKYKNGPVIGMRVPLYIDNSILLLDRVREHVKQKLCYESRVAGPPQDYSYSCRDSTLLSTLCPYHRRRVTGVFQSVPPS